VKIVEFAPLKAKNVMSLGFGDLLADGSIDYKASSNNGDIIKVLATVIDILRHFTAQHPATIVFFTGSTDDRTKLYTRILKMYYAAFSTEFMLYGVIGTEENSKILPFDPGSGREYLAFFIKRIN
jgi:hypothetical protein